MDLAGNSSLHATEILRLDDRGTVDFPTYRVTFWSLPVGRGLPSPYPTAFNAEHWRLSEVTDVHEVLSWARRDGRMFELFIERAIRDFEVQDVRIAGFNPTLGEEVDPVSYLSLAEDVTFAREQLTESHGQR
jgi:hypothetical protein